MSKGFHLGEQRAFNVLLITHHDNTGHFVRHWVPETQVVSQLWALCTGSEVKETKGPKFRNQQQLSSLNLIPVVSFIGRAETSGIHIPGQIQLIWLIWTSNFYCIAKPIRNSPVLADYLTLSLTWSGLGQLLHYTSLSCCCCHTQWPRFFENEYQVRNSFGAMIIFHLHPISYCHYLICC
jgi:hypothetical protein